MVKRVPNYQLVKLRIPQTHGFPISKHIFDKTVVEKNVYSIKSVNLKFADKFTPPNGAMVARWIRPSIHEGELIGGFFTVNIIACKQEDVAEIRKPLMKEYTPMMLDWMKDKTHDEEWEMEKHSFIVTYADGEFSLQIN